MTDKPRTGQRRRKPVGDKGAVKPISSETGAKARELVILYNGPLNRRGFGKILDLVPSIMGRPVTLILVTYGGAAEPAYRITRLLQDLAGEFTLCVPGLCKSAGTLVATGAKKLMIMPLAGEIGPLDVQLLKRDELGERKSGLVKRAIFNSLNEYAFDWWKDFIYRTKIETSGAIQFRTAAATAERLAALLFGQVFSQIDPELIGEDFRDMQVAHEYARRLAKVGGNISEEMIRHLVNEYPSHDFVIDFREAKEIFEKVSIPPRPLRDLILSIGPDALMPRNELVVRLVSEPVVAEEVQDDAREGGERTRGDGDISEPGSERAADTLNGGGEPERMG